MKNPNQNILDQLRDAIYDFESKASDCEVKGIIINQRLYSEFMMSFRSSFSYSYPALQGIGAEDGMPVFLGNKLYRSPDVETFLIF